MDETPVDKGKRVARLPIYLITCALLTGVVGHAAESPNWQHAYQFPHGASGPLLVNNGYAYILNGWTRGHLVQAYDVRRPESPAYVGGLAGRGYPLQSAFSQDGRYLYVPTWFALMVIDVSNPVELRTVRSMSFGFPYGDAGPVAVDGDTLYVGGKRGGGIRVFDISRPDAPVISAWYPQYGSVRGLTISGRRLLVRKSGPLVIFSLGDSGIEELATLDIRGNHCLAGDILYCVHRRKNVNAYDLTAPANPTEVHLGAIPALAVVGILDDAELLVVEDDSTLAVHDVKSPVPTKKREIALEHAAERCNGAQLVGHHLFLVDKTRSALVVYDISGGQAREVGLANFIRNESRMEIGDKYAWSLFRDRNVLRARGTDLSNPGITPIAVSVDVGDIQRENQTKVHDVLPAGDGKLVGRFLLMGDGLVDVSNPRAPEVIRQASVPALSTHVRGGLAFLAQGKQLVINDVSRLPEMPTVATYTPGGAGNHIVDVILEGDLAYLINNAKANRKDASDRTRPSLMVLDISSPAKPVLKAQCPIRPSISGAKKGRYIFLPGVSRRDGAGGIEIVDVSTPGAPQVVKQLDDDTLLATTCYRARIRGDRLFVTDSMRGIKELDISDPLAPVQVRSYFGPTDTSSSYTDFEFVGNELYGQRYAQIDVWTIGE